MPLECICCEQGHPKDGALARVPGARWCHQCQKDGCAQPKKEPEPVCTVREHAGLEKAVMKMGIGAPLLPDPELGQDVAFLCHVIGTMAKKVESTGITVEKSKLKGHLSDICDEASHELDGMNPEHAMAKQYGARLRMAQELIQMIDAGEFV
jgi:hypothetical protein